MSFPLATGFSLPRFLMWLCLACLAITLCARRASKIDMDDDNLYLAYGAQSQHARAEPLEQDLIDRVAATPGCEESAFRLAFRKRYASNYAGYAAVQRVVQHVAGLFVPAGPMTIIAASLATKGLVLLLLAFALALAASRGSSPELEAAAICAFIVLVGLDFVPEWARPPQRVSITHLGRTIVQQVSSLFVIAKAHSYFEVTPRNGALLMFAISLLLKWQGRLTAAVLALLLLAPLHQTYGGIGLVLFAVASTLSRPELFAAPLRRAILVGAGLSYVMREHFLQRHDILIQILAAGGLVLAALLFVDVVGSARFAALRERCLGGWGAREVVVDAAALIAFVALVTLLSWVGDQVMADPITRRYVWANFPIRTLSFVRFPMFTAIFWFVLTRSRWLSGPSGRAWFAAACGVSCLALGGLCVANVDSHVWGRLQGQMERNLRPARKRGIFNPQSEENRIYAHLTMVAAGELEPGAAERSVVAGRALGCQHQH